LKTKNTAKSKCWIGLEGGCRNRLPKGRGRQPNLVAYWAEGGCRNRLPIGQRAAAEIGCRRVEGGNQTWLPTG